MGVPVIITDVALADLEQIVKFIALHDQSRAKSFGNLLIDRALAIGPFPEIGRILPERKQPSVREVIHGNYRIIYKICDEPKAVFVLRFWHAARGTPELRER